MDLQGGLNAYKADTRFYEWAMGLEECGWQILGLIREQGDTPSPVALRVAWQFIVDIEEWKAGCLGQRTGNAATNSEHAVWSALHAATQATDDLAALRAIMVLRGFGSAADEVTGQRRAKVATAVLRFLWPHRWGVVDWRVTAILNFLDRTGWDYSAAVSQARGWQAKDLRDLYNILDEYAAADINERYRQISSQQAQVVPRAADVDMALFGLSLMAWRME